MANDIVRCVECGAKNRLKDPPVGQLPACGKCGAHLPWLVDATDGSFDKSIQAGVPVVVDFWAPWCGPCKVVAPVLEDLSRELAGKLKVVKVNVDENQLTAGRFKVQSIPMLAVFRGGILVDQMMGAMPKGALKSRLEPHLPS
jgi:thioredoxin 2